MNIRNDKRKGLSYSEMARKYNIDRRTAKRYSMSDKKPKYKELMEDIDYLVNEQKKQKYSVVKDISQWKNVEKLKNSENKIKFISFCPSKYGIDW